MRPARSYGFSGRTVANLDRRVNNRRVSNLGTVLRRGFARAGLQSSLTVWVALLALIIASPILAPGSLSGSALRGMLPFAAVLAIAAIGQTLVIQQGGLDFSVPGAISLSAIILTHHAGQQESGVVGAIVIALVVGTAAGAVSGLLVARASIQPIIATLGVGALLVGVADQVSNQLVVPAPARFTHFMLEKTLGIPNTFVIAVVLVILVAIPMRKTVFGRQLEFTGTSAAAARTAGLPVVRIRVAAYALAGTFYAVAGIVLAGYLGNPDINAGNPYLLSTVTAVVLGGAALTGGRASVIATAVAAVFLVQLEQVILSSGAEVWAQYMTQGVVIALAMAVRTVPWRLLGRRLRRDPEPTLAQPTAEPT
jgi:ribose transport system permease protein